jgi:hypothetical protein
MKTLTAFSRFLIARRLAFPALLVAINLGCSFTAFRRVTGSMASIFFLPPYALPWRRSEEFI